jgi:prolyl oligopeptidase PreP (S9A serine peptidase family)
MLTERFNVSDTKFQYANAVWMETEAFMRANLRGGGEYGRNGRNQNAKKQNVFMISSQQPNIL